MLADFKKLIPRANVVDLAAQEIGSERINA